MPKLETRFFCSSCGQNHPRWAGQCSACGEWNTLVEEKASPVKTRFIASLPAQSPTLIAQIDYQEEDRIPTGLSELDRVLGGGVVPGVVIIDSIQTMFREDITSAAGSVSQVRECAA